MKRIRYGLAFFMVLLSLLVLSGCKDVPHNYPKGTIFICDFPSITLVVAENGVIEGTLKIDNKTFPINLFAEYGTLWKPFAEIEFESEEHGGYIIVLTGDYVQTEHSMAIKNIKVSGSELFQSLQSLEGRTIVFHRKPDVSSTNPQ